MSERLEFRLFGGNLVGGCVRLIRYEHPSKSTDIAIRGLWIGREDDRRLFMKRCEMVTNAEQFILAYIVCA